MARVGIGLLMRGEALVAASTKERWFERDFQLPQASQSNKVGTRRIVEQLVGGRVEGVVG
jgi:hypothetical protein